MTDWELLKLNATKCLNSNTEWTSFIFHKRYKVLAVYDNKIMIEKVPKGAPVRLSKKLITKAANKLKTELIVKKGNLLSNSVSRETSFVYLHPFVDWNKKTKEFIWNNHNSLTHFDITSLVDEASDDDLQKILAEINKRKNQGKFRKKMLEVYEKKCCISNSEVLETLEAAHISFHSKTGINNSANGLLLKVDLHLLFDRNLLLIHPTKLTVHIHPRLLSTEYSIYNNIRINTRKDKKPPNEVYLKEKWDNSNWIKN